MSTANDGIKSRIEKLLKLAENNSNANEISNALAMAEKLMREYSLSKEDILPEDNEFIQVIVKTTEGKNKVNWKGSFGVSVADANFVKVIWGFHGNLIFFGKKKNVDMAVFMFNNFTAQLEKACEYEWNRWKNVTDSHGKTWKMNYYMAACRAISLHQTEQRNYMKINAPAADNLALSVLESELEKKYQDTFHPHNSGKAHYNYDANAREQGRKFGKEFSFNERLG